jgi:hypothetical protein
MGSKGWGLSSVDVGFFTNCQSRRRWVVSVEIEKIRTKSTSLLIIPQKAKNGNSFQPFNH